MIEFEIAELSYANKVGNMKIHSAQKQARLMQMPLDRLTEMLNDALHEQFGKGPKARVTSLDVENNVIHFTTVPVQVGQEFTKSDYMAQIVSNSVSIIHGFELSCLAGMHEDFNWSDPDHINSIGLRLRQMHDCTCDAGNTNVYMADLGEDGLVVSTSPSASGGDSVSIPFDKSPDQVAETVYRLLADLHDRYEHFEDPSS